MSQRNYDSTGVVDKAVDIFTDGKNGLFYFYKGEEKKEFTSLAFFIERCWFKPDSGNAEKRVPPHFKLVIEASYKDQDDNEIHTVRFNIASYYKTAFPSIVNPLAKLAKDGHLHDTPVTLYVKKNGDYLNMGLYDDQSGGHFPGLLEWDSEAKNYKDAPPIVSEEHATFWLDLANKHIVGSLAPGETQKVEQTGTLSFDKIKGKLVSWLAKMNDMDMLIKNFDKIIESIHENEITAIDEQDKLMALVNAQIADFKQDKLFVAKTTGIESIETKNDNSLEDSGDDLPF